MLVLIGVGFSIGNMAGGRLADRSLDGSLIGFLVLLIATMLAFPVLAKTHAGAAAALLVWGIATFAVVPPLQMRVMRAAAEAPGLASSINVGRSISATRSERRPAALSFRRVSAMRRCRWPVRSLRLRAYCWCCCRLRSAGTGLR